MGPFPHFFLSTGPLAKFNPTAIPELRSIDQWASRRIEDGKKGNRENNQLQHRTANQKIGRRKNNSQGPRIKKKIKKRSGTSSTIRPALFLIAAYVTPAFSLFGPSSLLIGGFCTVDFIFSFSPSIALVPLGALYTRILFLHSFFCFCVLPLFSHISIIHPSVHINLFPTVSNLPSRALYTIYTLHHQLALIAPRTSQPLSVRLISKLTPWLYLILGRANSLLECFATGTYMVRPSAQRARNQWMTLLTPLQKKQPEARRRFH